MTDKEFLEHMDAQCTEAILGGCIMDHCWLGNSKKDMEALAGNWKVSTNTKNMARLIELAKKGLDKPNPAIKISTVDSLIRINKGK